MADERVLSLMEDAVRSLEPPLSQEVKIALSHFRDEARRDQLDRAWDALSQAGTQAAAPPVFWRFLRDAASLMGWAEQSAEASRRGRLAH